MAQTYEFLIARADEAAAEAKNAGLENLRQRALRSEAAWREMAARTLRVDQNREARERERVANAQPPQA
jgi:hypothetical protein